MHFVDEKCCLTVYCFIFRGCMWEMTYKPQLTILKTFFISYTVHNRPILFMCASYTMIILVTELHSVSGSDNDYNTGRN